MIKCLEHMAVLNQESTGLETAVGDITVIIVLVLMCRSPMCIQTTEMSTWEVPVDHLCLRSHAYVLGNTFGPDFENTL